MTTPNIRLINTDESEALFQLIDRNRNRLLRYFPGTMKEMADKASTKLVLNKKIGMMKNRELFPFGIYDDQQLIGWISIKNIDWGVSKAELGYYIDQEYEGKGLMSFAVRTIIDYGFEQLDLNKIFLRIGPDNIGSKKIALKNGFVQEGILRKEFKVESGELVDILYYGLLRNDKSLTRS